MHYFFFNVATPVWFGQLNTFICFFHQNQIGYFFELPAFQRFTTFFTFCNEHKIPKSSPHPKPRYNGIELQTR